MKYLKTINEDRSHIQYIGEHPHDAFHSTALRLLVEHGFNNTTNLISVPSAAYDEYFKLLLFFNELPEIYHSENNRLNIKNTKLDYYAALLIAEKNDIQIAQINIRGTLDNNEYSPLKTFLLDAKLYNLIEKNVPMKFILKYKSISKELLKSIIDLKDIGFF